MEKEGIHTKPRLTELSHGSGCGCKIAPNELEAILKEVKSSDSYPNILIDNGDDAAVIDIGDGRAIIQTTDFFMPIVDDPKTFGKIAAANALSDVYAMGGAPMSALAILGWPVEQLGTHSASEVMKGAKEICSEAGISLAGGHSIDSKQPFFGLSVNGIIDHDKVKANHTVQDGDYLYLTKPIGVGILATALKRGIATTAMIDAMTESMCRLNNIGAKLGGLETVSAMTDVTGFGLLGHLLEMLKPGDFSARIHMEHVPILEPEAISQLLQQFVMPDNTMRNFKAYSTEVNQLSARQLQLLCDPQTSGGLLLAVRPEGCMELEEILSSNAIGIHRIGQIHRENQGARVLVE